MENHPLTRLLLLSCLFVIFSCEEELLLPAENVETVNKAEHEFASSFSLAYFDDPAGLIQDNLIVDWNSVITDTIEGMAWQEFKITENRPITYGPGEILAYNYTLLAHKDGKGENHFYLTKFLSYGDDMEHSFFRITTDFYHGMVYLYTMEGITDYIFYYQKGKMANAIAHKDLEEDKIAPLPKLLIDGGIAKGDLMAARGGTYYVTSWAGTSGGQGGGSGGVCRGCSGGSTSGGWMYAWVTVQYETVWYNLRPNGVAEESYIQDHKPVQELRLVPINSPTRASTSTSASFATNFATQAITQAGAPVGAPKYTSTPPKNAMESPTTIVLDKSLKDHPCIANTINKLLRLDNNLLKKTIGAFANDPKYDLIFKVGNCSTTDLACTNADELKSHGKINIIIEDTKLSPIATAAAVIHEGIHAELFRYVSRFETGVDPNKRERLFQLYAFYKGWATTTQDSNYNWKTDAQHNYMMENYVTKIAEAVKQFDGNKYPLSYYMAYGWDGLTSYGYTSKKLSSPQNLENQRLRNIAASNAEKCN